jgi:uncharacterized protein (DUF849 family)
VLLKACLNGPRRPDEHPALPVGPADGPTQRLAAVRGWSVVPDFASVNWHEAGSVELAGELLERGVGVEAGLWTPEAVESWNAWSQRSRCLRVLLEVPAGRPALDNAELVVAARAILDRVQRS